jgi:hypothetical protein
MGSNLRYIKNWYSMRLVITFLIVFLLISPTYGAGLGSVESKISSDEKYYNKGVELMLKNGFEKHWPHGNNLPKPTTI